VSGTYHSTSTEVYQLSTVIGFEQSFGEGVVIDWRGGVDSYDPTTNEQVEAPSNH
jgi:hypothetical protein